MLVISEKETERAEEELGTMDSLSPRATHHCCQVSTATQQPIHVPAGFLQLQLLQHYGFPCHPPTTRQQANMSPPTQEAGIVWPHCLYSCTSPSAGTDESSCL